ncbi:DNA-protecting protein DprA [Alphaproteobacteria bacterium KMM 3653]|uniref:DNA-protecting protein DprA n=1 Tax=Harenicola maris TaxID=2841044 RepID=A0AAP2CPA7_9RHOB|nr:DNA-protecting protein DprA [Harenicola maris]
MRSRRVGPATFFRLMTEHGSAEAALDALPRMAAEAGLPNYEVCPEGVARAELAAGYRLGAVPIFAGSAADSPLLGDISDRPVMLWALGDPALLRRPSIALVGARNASSVGKRMARSLANDLGEAGFVLASGMARGIDAAAHTAALPTGTIAVLAGGVDVIYPQENKDLYTQIVRNGLILSEHPPGFRPMARHFPARNRIVAGLSRALVVVEAAAKSGSLITARCALDQGREVLAVPGHPFDGRAAGGNLLIRDGAALVRSAADIIEVTGPAPMAQDPRQQAFFAPPQAAAPILPPPTGSPAKPRNLTRKILSLLGAAPVSEDQLSRDLGLPPQALSRQLTTLEILGELTRSAGGLVSRTEPLPVDPPRKPLH